MQIPKWVSAFLCLLNTIDAIDFYRFSLSLKIYFIIIRSQVSTVSLTYQKEYHPSNMSTPLYSSTNIDKIIRFRYNDDRWEPP